MEVPCHRMSAETISVYLMTFFIPIKWAFLGFGSPKTTYNTTFYVAIGVDGGRNLPGFSRGKLLL